MGHATRLPAIARNRRGDAASASSPMKPLFILPGLLEDADGFKQVVEALAGVARCTVADLTHADTMSGMARDALRQAPEGSFCLAGHSMGGYAALEIMRQAPQRVERLALLNTHARPDTEESTANRRRLMDLADRDFEAVLAAMMPKLMTEEHLADPLLTGTLGAMKIAIGPEGFKRQQAAIIGRIDSRPSLAGIRCPTLVVAAREDALMPVELLEELAAGIPGARLAVIEQCGHMAALEKPAEVAALLKEWMA
jgi:pimeloyl-ACP methyl ester carboxylesterase